jgi:hypothetical protein
LPKDKSRASRPDRQERRRVVVRPPVSAVEDSLTPPARANLAARPAAPSAAAPVSTARAAWAPVARTSGRGGTIRDEDYHYIYGDLRRIGILAASIFVALIALTFVLR